MLETNARKGLQAVSYAQWHPRGLHRGHAYKIPVRVESVEMDDALKAEHCVEPFRGMQFCAAAIDIVHASAASRAVDLITAMSLVLIG